VLARDALWSTTYKPALLKALVRLVARGAGRTISLADVGEQFVALYWTQTVVFHLRQAAVISKEPEVVRAIRTAADAAATRRLDGLSPAIRTNLVRGMQRILKINVLRAFHRSKPAHMPELFMWRDGMEHIELSETAHAFIAANALALETVANYWWAGYLEKVNTLAPYIIEKVRRDGARRGSLAPYLRILAALDSAQCFYCGRPFGENAGIHVDHVLPWSFLLQDPLWDLVMACSRCNLAKSDSLPDLRFIDKLIATNAARAKAQLPLKRASPLLDAPQIHQYYDAARAVEWPGPWSPG